MSTPKTIKETQKGKKIDFSKDSMTLGRQKPLKTEQKSKPDSIFSAKIMKIDRDSSLPVKTVKVSKKAVGSALYSEHFDETSASDHNDSTLKRL